MTVLTDDQKGIPVTVTLKAETVMALMLVACHLPNVSADEFQKLGDAFSAALKI